MSEKQNAETLLNLSGIDIDILRLQKQLDELPHKQQILDVRLRRRELESKSQQVEKMAAETLRVVKLLTDETELNESQIKQVQASLDKSSDYRETASLAAEMEMLANRKAKLEEDNLAQLEKQEKVIAVQQQVIDTAKKLELEEQTYTEAYREAGGKLLQEISDLKQAREALVDTLPADLEQRYNKALASKSGIGAAHLMGNQCSGCHSSLSDGQLAKLMEGPSIGECPNCKRLIVVM